MRFLRIFFLLIFFSFECFSNEIVVSKGENSFAVKEKTSASFKVYNHLNVINSNIIKTEDGDFTKLTVPYYSTNSDIGAPELPSLKKLINIPAGANISVNVINKVSKIISLEDFGIQNLILPNQPSISKSKSAEEIEFFYEKDFYNKDVFTNDELVSFEILGSMREVQLARIIISPISYNPVTNEIEVVTKLEVEVNFSVKNSFFMAISQGFKIL